MAAAVSGKPLTATCYCPIYTTKQPFLVRPARTVSGVVGAWGIAAPQRCRWLCA